MSTNHKIRQIAEKLPLVPKLHKGKPQHDHYTGRLITLNHFRELKKIYEQYKESPKVRDHLCGKYVEAAWELHFMYKDIVEKQRKEQKIVLYAKIAMWLILSVAAVKFLLNQL